MTIDLRPGDGGRLNSSGVPGAGWELGFYSKRGLWHVPEHYFDGYPETRENWRLAQSLFNPGTDGRHEREVCMGLVGTPSGGPRKRINFTFKFYNAYSEPVITMGPYEWTIRNNTTYYPGTPEAHWMALNSSTTLQPGETCLVTFQFVTQEPGTGPLFPNSDFPSDRAGYIFREWNDDQTYDPIAAPTGIIDEQSMREPYVVIYEEGVVDYLVPFSVNTAWDIVGETPVVSNVRWVNLYGQTITEVPFYDETHMLFTWDRVNYGATAHKTIMPTKSWHTRKYVLGPGWTGGDITPASWFDDPGDGEQEGAGGPIAPRSSSIDIAFGYSSGAAIGIYAGGHDALGYARNGRQKSAWPYNDGHPQNVPTDYEMYSGADGPITGQSYDDNYALRNWHIRNSGNPATPNAPTQNYVIRTEQGEAMNKYPRFVTFGAACQLTRPYVNPIGITGNGFNGTRYFANGWGGPIAVSYLYSNTGRVPAVVDTLSKSKFPRAGSRSNSYPYWTPSGTYDVFVANDIVPVGSGTTTSIWIPEQPVDYSVFGSPVLERNKYSDHYGQTPRARLYSFNYGFADFPELGKMYTERYPEPIKLNVLFPFTINLTGMNYSRFGEPDWTTELAPTNSTSEYYLNDSHPNWEKLIEALAETSGAFGGLTSASWNYGVGVASALTTGQGYFDYYYFTYYNQPQLQSGFANYSINYPGNEIPLGYYLGDSPGYTQSSPNAWISNGYVYSAAARLYIKVLYSLGGANANTITVTAIDELGRVATDSIEFTFPQNGGWNIGTIPGNQNGGWSI